MSLKEEASEVFSFSVTDPKLKKQLHEWQDDKMFSAMMNKLMKKVLHLES